ncbi:MAG TPA: hypothetical protein VLY87_00850 [Flavobacterium sp.]|nr:hypothetical protein [Flavobacterium sp.]
MKKNKFLTVILITSLFVTSCAVNQKVDYNNLKMDLFNVKSESLNIALLDHREAVIDGSRKANFTGYMRSNVGIAYPISTKTGNDFINEISNNIIKSLNKFNVKAFNIPSKYSEDENSVKEKLLQTKGDKKMLLTFNELHTDGYAIQVLHYDFDISVFDKNNELIAYKKFQDKRKLGGTVAFGAGPYKRYMPEAVTKLFEDIFNDPEILNALNNTNS